MPEADFVRFGFGTPEATARFGSIFDPSPAVQRLDSERPGLSMSPILLLAGAAVVLFLLLR